MEEESTAQPSEESRPMNGMQRLTGTFFEPASTFEDIARRPTWVLPLVLTLALTALVMYLHPLRVNQDAMIKAQIKQAQSFGAANVDPAQLETAIRGRMNSWWGKYGSILTILVFGGLATLALAGIMMLAFTLGGASIGFKRSLSALCWSAVPTTLCLSLLAILFLYLKNQDDLSPLNPFENVISNLGFLIKADSQPVLQGLLGSIDVFSFWRIYLTGAAFAAASLGGISRRNAVVVVVVLWVLYVMGKAGLTGLFT